MRSFDDAQGNRWNAALLSASYGNVMLIFSPLYGDDTRQQPMPVEDMAEAEAQLAALDEGELRSLLAQSQPWDPGAGGV